MARASTSATATGPSTGKVGLCGVFYYAMSQWLAAVRQRADLVLHARGNFSGSTGAASQQKWLQVRGGRHEEWFYQPEGYCLVGSPRRGVR